MEPHYDDSFENGEMMMAKNHEDGRLAKGDIVIVRDSINNGEGMEFITVGHELFDADFAAKTKGALQILISEQKLPYLERNQVKTACSEAIKNLN